jgi:hypothetical protein
VVRVISPLRTKQYNNLAQVHFLECVYRLVLLVVGWKVSKSGFVGSFVMFLEEQEVHLGGCLILIAILLCIVRHREDRDQGDDK